MILGAFSLSEYLALSIAIPRLDLEFRPLCFQLGNAIRGHRRLEQTQVSELWQPGQLIESGVSEFAAAERQLAQFYESSQDVRTSVA